MKKRILLKYTLFGSVFTSKRKKQFSNLAKFAIAAGFLVLFLYLTFSTFMAYRTIDGDMGMFLLSLYITTIFTIIIMSIHQLPNLLLKFKDFDFLKSLPITEADIIFSKIFIVCVTNFLLNILIFMSSVTGAGLAQDKGAGFYLYYLFFSLGTTFFTVGIMILFFYFASKILMIINLKSEATSIILTLAAALALIVISVNSEFMTRILQNKFVGGIFIEQNLVFLSAFIFIAIAFFYVAILIFSKDFSIIHGRLAEVKTLNNFEVNNMDVMKKQSQVGALMKKEFSFLIKTPAYLINCYFSVIGYFIFSVFSLFMDNEDVLRSIGLSGIGADKGLMIYYIAIASVFVVATCTANASSISLEGKYVYILKSLPVDTLDILSSKILFQIFLSLPPTLIATTILSFTAKIPMMGYFQILVLTILVSFASSQMHLMTNLIFPKMDWNTETEVVKRSLSSILSILVAGFFYAIFFVLREVFLIGNISTLLIIYLVIVLLLNFLMFLSINKLGVSLFKRLQ